MRVAIIGLNASSYIYGSLLSSVGISVVHYTPNKTLGDKDLEPIEIVIDHYYPKNKYFTRTLQTKRLYIPKKVATLPSNIDLLIFAGCYDQVITHLKKIVTENYSIVKTNCLVQIQNWKSVEYLQTILGINPVFWISTMVKGYFVNNNNKRSIRGMLIKKVAIQIDSPHYRESVNFALLLSEVLRVDFFEVTNILQPNRIWISLYTPMVLYIIKFIKEHWRKELSALNLLSQYYKQIQPFLYDHIKNNGPFKEVVEYANIYNHDDKRIYGLISKIISKRGTTILDTLVQSALHNKYEADEAIDLATEMIRWYAYFGKDVRSLKYLFDKDRVIWEKVIIKDVKLSSVKVPKTLLLEKDFATK